MVRVPSNSTCLMILVNVYVSASEQPFFIDYCMFCKEMFVLIVHTPLKHHVFLWRSMIATLATS